MTPVILVFAAIPLLGGPPQESRSARPHGDAVQEATPAPRRYLTDEQWAEIEKLPEMDRSRLVDVGDIDKLLAEGRVLLLDVREPDEIRDLGTIPGSVHIPFLQLERRLGELPKDKIILPACNTGTGRAPRAAAMLLKHGYRVAGFCGLRNYKGQRVHPPIGRRAPVPIGPGDRLARRDVQ